jgi:hypothetical protein
MKIESVIRVILDTPKLKGTFIELAALAARTGASDAVAEVSAFWRKLGGTVES